MQNKEKLGMFQIESGECYVVDPCYNVNEFDIEKLQNIKKGMWESKITLKDEGEFGTKVSKLEAKHIQAEKEIINISRIFKIDVDSGQAGIFDCNYYDSENKNWYYNCCDITCSKKKAGVINFGTVTSTGYGDDTYSCLVYENSTGEIVKICIIFIENYEDREIINSYHNNEKY